MSVWQIGLLVVGGLLVLAVGSALLTRLLIKRGLRTPWAVARINRIRDRVVAVVKRPITIMVLDEVTDVIRTGHYTENISSALLENSEELKLLVAEKVRQDIRLVGRLPLYDAVVSEVSGTVLRVVIDMLGDPRMDELVSDLLRNNIDQIRQAVRARHNENVPPPAPPDPAPAGRRP